MSDIACAFWDSRNLDKTLRPSYNQTIEHQAIWNLPVERLGSKKGSGV